MGEELKGYNSLTAPTGHFANGSFAEALWFLKRGGRVCRRGWNGRGMWLALQVPDEHSKMQQPYIYMSPADGKLIPWLASQTDLLSNDWESIEG